MIFLSFTFSLILQVSSGSAQSIQQLTGNPINPCDQVLFNIYISPPTNYTYTSATFYGNGVAIGTFPNNGTLNATVSVAGNDGTGHYNVYAVLTYNDGALQTQQTTNTVAVQIAAMALNPISGAANLNCTSAATFSSSFVSTEFVPAASQVASYAWTLPNSNWVINSGNMSGGSTTPTITVTPDATGTGNMQITAKLTCGYTFTSPVLAVTRATPPPTFSSSNPNAVCNDATSTFAINAPCGSTSYNWTISGNSNVTFQANGTQSLTTTTPSAAVSGGTVGSSGVTLAVQAVWPGGATSGTTSESLATGVPATPTYMTPAHENVAPNQTVSFICVPSNHWSVGEGTILTGQGTDAITVKIANVSSGTLSVVANGINSCGAGGNLVSSYPIVSGGGGGFLSYNSQGDLTSSANEGFRTLSSVTSPTVYPNPAINSFNVLLPLTDFTKTYIKIYDMGGHLLQAVFPVGQATLIDASHWAKGTYVVMIFDGKQLTTRKFIKP
jgi:hypothetical protein